MSQSISVVGLTLIQLVLVICLGKMVSVGVVWLVFASMALLYGLFLRLSTLRSFALLVAILLGNAFFAVAQGWQEGWDIETQYSLIMFQLVVLGIVTASWAQAVELRKWAGAYEQAKKEADSLRKRDEAVSVLSAHEFYDRLQAIVASLRRRNEPGMLIVVSIPSRVTGYGGRRCSTEAVLQVIGEAASAAVRDQFDIVGRLSHATIAIALQRCTREGSERVLQRLYWQLQKQRRVRVDVIKSWVYVEELPVTQGWQEVKAGMEDKWGQTSSASVRGGA